MGLLDMNVFNMKKTETENPEIAEFKKRLAGLEQSKRELIFKIGAIFVEKNDLESVAGTEYEGLLLQLDQGAKEAETLNKRILAAQGLRKCEKCGNTISLDSAFCSKCGEKLEPLFTEEVNKDTCSNCGASLERGASFCAVCGTKIQ